MKRFVTRALILMASILGIVFAQIQPASAQGSGELASNLATLWTTVLQTPSDQNPFTNPKADACFDLGNSTVAPFAGGVKFSCTVTPDTSLFVVGFSTECSTFDDDCDGDPDFGDCNAATAGGLLECARLRDSNKAPTVTLDGNPVPLTEVKTAPLKIVLPADNVFGEPAGTEGLSVAHGFVALLDPLPRGNHEIVITSNTGKFPTGTTQIKVK